jgi:DNA polymerase-3 subunit alpha
VEKYKFDCGCEFTVESPTIKEIDGLPSLHIDFSSINHNCPKTWEVFHSGMTKGVFQLENKLGQDWSKKIKPSNLDELSAVISVIRPGTLKSKLDGTSLTQHFADRKNGSELTEFIHESLRPILASTYGILVYQEQAMRIAVDLAGFNLQEADTLRKCVTGDTTFISKQRGFISINELLETGYENDDFLIMDENGVQRWKKIEKIWSTGKHDVVEIETINGLSVKATKYHQFLTNNGWKARCRLDDNDYLVCPSVISYDGKDEN